MKETFYTVYIGQGISLLSLSAAQYSIIWWATVQTEPAIAPTIASMVGLLPQPIIRAFAGVWIDRCHRKTIIILAQLPFASNTGPEGVPFASLSEHKAFSHIKYFLPH